jgi:hypothetical protein
MGEKTDAILYKKFDRVREEFHLLNGSSVVFEYDDVLGDDGGLFQFVEGSKPNKWETYHNSVCPSVRVKKMGEVDRDNTSIIEELDRRSMVLFVECEMSGDTYYFEDSVVEVVSEEEVNSRDYTGEEMTRIDEFVKDNF